jgi:hypothetical protein
VPIFAFFVYLSVLQKRKKLEQTKKSVPSQTLWNQRQNKYCHHLQATKYNKVARSL